MKTLFSLFLLLFSLAALAQDEKPKTPEKPKRRLSFSQLFKEIENCKDTIYRLENAVIKVDTITDQRYTIMPSAQIKDTIFVNIAIHLKNIQMESPYNEIKFSKFHFYKNITFENITSNVKFGFTRSIFNGLIDLKKIHSNEFYLAKSLLMTKFTFSEIKNSKIAFIENIVRGHTYFWNLNNLKIEFDKNTFEGCNVVSYSENIYIFINQCRFLSIKHDKYLNYFRSLTINQVIGSNVLSVHNSYFKKNNLALLQDFGVDLPLTNLELKKDTIDFFTFLHTNITQSCLFEDLVLKDNVSFKGSNFPLLTTVADWKQISKKLVIQDDDHLGSYLQNKFYKIRTDSDFADNKNFQKLIASYMQFYSIYKATNNTESANLCFVEMKTLETRKSAYEYRKNPTLKTFLDWQMNEFLHTFSDYGTDYVKSLIYAFYVILLFALIYFIFPSQEDNLSKNRFLKFFTKAIQYFRTDTQLTDFQQEKRKEELEKLENFRQNLIDSQGKIPRIIAFLGKPFYYQNLYFTEFALWLLHRTDLAKGKWSEIPAKRKLFLGSLVTVYFVFYVCNGLFMRALNALALSLNFFTTLGYGEMQARGWIKYLAVLEGAVGWFLLTVFSASLVSQLLQ